MRGILDAIFWRLHTAFMTNQRDDARTLLSFLEEEASARGGDSAISSEIGPTHMGRYRKIRERTRSGEFGRLHGDGAGVDEACVTDWSWAKEEQGASEREFCRSLLKEKDKFLASIGFEFWSDVVPEADVRPYGRCDFLVYEGRRAGVVEVKMGKAPTSLVSQVDSYRVALELDMCLGLWDEVVPMVMASGFPPYASSELSRMGVMMLTHDGTVDSIRKITDKRKRSIVA